MRVSGIAEDHPVLAPARLLLVCLALASTACAKPRVGGQTAPGDDPCGDFEVQVERWWSASIRAEVLERGGELELEKRSGVVTKLDRISEDWLMMRTSTCKDHFVRGLIDQDEYAARVRCFDDRLDRQRSLATALTAGGELAEIEGALDLLLAEPASCTREQPSPQPSEN